ncbi:MAG: acyl carrier protein [Candidatus Omnitrophota bacterium]|nr:MAG: acyl carrier protein [Candidatus Omnitrophota bacterium]
MDRKEIEKKVREILADKLDIDIKKIKLDSDLVDDLGMDSFKALELAFELKEKFGIEIKEEEFSKIQKVKHIVEYAIDRGL